MVDQDLLQIFAFHQPTLFQIMKEIEERYMELIQTHVNEGIHSSLFFTKKILNEELGRYDRTFEKRFPHSGRNDPLPQFYNRKVDEFISHTVGLIDSVSELDSHDYDTIKQTIITTNRKLILDFETQLDAVKGVLTAIVFDLQCHDETTQIITHLRETFRIAVQAVCQYLPEIYQEVNFEETLQKMYKLLTLTKEKRIFQKVFYPVFIEKNETQILPVIDFLTMYLTYFKKTLHMLLISLEKILLNFQYNLSNFIIKLDERAQGTLQIKRQLEDMLLAMEKKGDVPVYMHPFVAIVVEGENLAKSQQDLSLYITQLLMPMQFHDRVRQFARNLQAILFLIQKSLFFEERDIPSIFDLSLRNFRPFKRYILEKTTTNEERAMIDVIFN